MSAEWLNAIESLRKIGLTKVCIVIALTIAGLLFAGGWLGTHLPALGALWSGWAPSILIGTLMWVAVSVVEWIYSAVAKRVFAWLDTRAAERRQTADARQLEAARNAKETRVRALLVGLDEAELYVLRSYIERSSRDLDWSITYVTDKTAKKRVEAAIDSLIARKIVDYNHWLRQEFYHFLIKHPDVIGSTIAAREIWEE